MQKSISVLNHFKILKKEFITLSLFFLSFNLFSQVKSVKRLEIDLNDGYVKESLHTFKEKGFIISSMQQALEDGNWVWKYDIYDKNLALTKTEKVRVKRKESKVEEFIDDNRIYTLYMGSGEDYSLVTVDAETGDSRKVTGVLPKSIKISDMAVLGDYAYFKSTLSGVDNLFSVNWKTGIQKQILIVVEGIKPKLFKLQNFQLLKESEEVMLFAQVKISKVKFDTFIIRLNKEGVKSETYNLSTTDDYNLMSVTSSKIGEKKYVFTGTYSKTNAYSSQGIYFCTAIGKNVGTISYYNFLDLNNFNNNISQKSKDKIEKQKDKAESRGKELLLNYNIAAHDIILKEDGFIFIGEAFYPTYRTEMYTTTQTINGVTTTVTRTRQVFDGFAYTHAVIVKFDLNGKKMWDQTFSLSPTPKPYVVKKFVSVVENSNDKLAMVFASSIRIYSMTLDRVGKVVKEQESEPIETKYEDDKLWLSNVDITFWFDNYFLAHGIQTIKNKELKGEDRKRRVYFVNKVLYQN